jgi:ADP-ribose pyrophosphatase YjhB (NUDIX family)
MEAAGGLVLNEGGDILVIYRRQHWDLPKGKLEYEESPEKAAVREVEEECGIHELEIQQLITKTYHTYTEKNKYILKKTHWYCMTTTDKSEPVPQEDEDIEKVRWMNREKIESRVFENTYVSIRDVFLEFFRLQINGQHLRERKG